MPIEPRRGPSLRRIVVWVVVGAIAVALIVSGIIGISVKGG